METGPKKGKADTGQHSGRNLPKRADLKRSAWFPTVIIPTRNPGRIQGCIIKESSLGNLRFVDFPKPWRAKAIDPLTANLLQKGATSQKLSEDSFSILAPGVNGSIVVNTGKFSGTVEPIGEVLSILGKNTSLFEGGIERINDFDMYSDQFQRFLAGNMAEMKTALGQISQLNVPGHFHAFSLHRNALYPKPCGNQPLIHAPAAE